MAKKELLGKSCIKGFEKAIEYELGHFYLYKMLANCMQTVGYFGAQAYFLAESNEEQEHYQKHIDFLNDLGITPKLPTLSPESNVSTLQEAIETAYENEYDLLKYYRKLYNDEVAEYPDVAEHLKFFIKTQVEAIGFYGDILARLETLKGDTCGFLIIDQELKNK